MAGGGGGWVVPGPSGAGVALGGGGPGGGGGMYDGADTDSLLLLEAVDQSGPIKPGTYHFFSTYYL